MQAIAELRALSHSELITILKSEQLNEKVRRAANCFAIDVTLKIIGEGAATSI